jgi:hypothetical protein
MIGIESNLKAAARVGESASNDSRFTDSLRFNTQCVLIHSLARRIMRVGRRHRSPINRWSCRLCNWLDRMTWNRAWFAGDLAPGIRTENNRREHQRSHGAQEIQNVFCMEVAHSSQTNQRPENFYENSLANRCHPVDPANRNDCMGLLLKDRALTSRGGYRTNGYASDRKAANHG